MSSAVTVPEVLAWLKKRGTEKNRLGMARFGLPSEHTFGVSMATMQPEATSEAMQDRANNAFGSRIAASDPRHVPAAMFARDRISHR